MTEGEKTVIPTEIWTPDEKLSANVGKMAWHLFLKAWDSLLKEKGDIETLTEGAEGAYRHCIEVAKKLEAINTGK